MHCVVRYTLVVRRIMPTISLNVVPYVSFLLSLETDALPISVFKKKCSLEASQHAPIVGDRRTAVEEEKKGMHILRKCELVVYVPHLEGNEKIMLPEI